MDGTGQADAETAVDDAEEDQEAAEPLVADPEDGTAFTGFAELEVREEAEGGLDNDETGHDDIAGDRVICICFLEGAGQGDAGTQTCDDKT